MILDQLDEDFKNTAHMLLFILMQRYGPRVVISEADIARSLPVGWSDYRLIVEQKHGASHFYLQPPEETPEPYNPYKPKPDEVIEIDEDGNVRSAGEQK